MVLLFFFIMKTMRYFDIYYQSIFSQFNFFKRNSQTASTPTIALKIGFWLKNAIPFGLCRQKISFINLINGLAYC